MEAKQEESHLFLSYSRADAPLVRRVGAGIEARGCRTWLDRVSIPSASDWMAEIRRGIGLADAFVFVITPHSLASRMCHVELAIASDLSKRLLPLWPLDQATWDSESRSARERSGSDTSFEVPGELQKLDYIDIADFADQTDPFEALMDELITAALRDLDWLRQHTRLQQDVNRWVAGRYSPATLLRGPLLIEAEAMLLTQKDPPLTPVQREFITESRAELRRTLEREAAQLAKRILDLPAERIATGVMLGLEGQKSYLPTPRLEGALRTLLSKWSQRALLRHGGAVTSADFNRDGQRILTASADGFVRLFESDTARLIAQFGDGNGPIWKAALTPDERRAAAACADGHVRIFTLDSSEVAEIHVSEEDVTDLAISPGGDTIVAASAEGLTVIDLVGQRSYPLPRHPAPIRALVFRSDHGVMTTCADGRVRFFDLPTQKWEEFSLPDRAINEAVVSPATKWLVLGGDFEGALVMDPETRAPVHLLKGPNGSALSLVISDNGERIAAGDIWGKAFVYDVASGDLLLKQQLFRRLARRLALSPDGTLLAGASSEGIAKVVDVSSGREQRLAGHDGPVNSIAFNPHGNTVLTGGDDGTARIFEVHSVPGHRTVLHESAAVFGADLSQNGSRIVAAGGDGAARIFQSDTGTLVAQYQGVGELLSATFEPGEEQVVAAFKDGRIVFLNASSGLETRTLQSSPVDGPAEVRFTPDRRWLVVYRFGEVVRVIDPQDGAVVEGLSESDRTGIVDAVIRQIGRSSSSGRLQDTDDDGPPTTYLQRGEERIWLQSPSHVIDARFGAEGAVVVGATLNQPELYVFDASTGEHLATLWVGHPANGLRFSGDGGWILTTWLNAISIVRYPAEEELIELARRQLHRELSEAERAEFGLPS